LADRSVLKSVTLSAGSVLKFVAQKPDSVKAGQNALKIEKVVQE
jgi:hypothetical protein